MNVIMKRDERLEQLYQECQDKIIQNIIGPFGLSKAMFDDKNGGNITTTHNFKQSLQVRAINLNMMSGRAVRI
jgi:hypothetical protein